VGPKDIPLTIVTTKDAVTTLTEGVVDATQMVGINEMKVTDVTCV